MGFPVYTTTKLIAQLGATNLAQFPLTPNEAKAHLYTNDVSPDANMTIVTFVEAVTPGTDPIEIVMSPVSMNDQGLPVSRSNLLDWQIGLGEDAVTVYGVYITNQLGTIVICAQRFDVPQVIGGVYETSISGLWRTSNPLTNYGWIDVEA